MQDRYAEERNKQLEKSLPYVPGPYVPGEYSVGKRDTHHFDIYAPRRPGYVQWFYEKNPTSIAYPMYDGERERAFAIRGEPGRIIVRDERWDKERPTPRVSRHFTSVDSAMWWISAQLLTGRIS